MSTTEIMNIAEVIQPIADKHEADVYLMNSHMFNKHVDTFIKTMIKEKKAQNCVLFLTTYGGSADAAFRLVRAIHRHYPNGKFILYVLGKCKSAGTLVAIGANKIFMGDFGEFGPLDVQLQKQDEFNFRESGMNHVECISKLHEQLFICFYQSFTQLIESSITTRTAAKIAKEISLGLLTPISAKIDPVKLADTYRAIAIAQDYAIRISRIGTKTSETVNNLIQNYHDHGFVIDYEEAKTIFSDVDFVSNDPNPQFNEFVFSTVRDLQEFPLILYITTSANKTT